MFFAFADYLQQMPEPSAVFLVDASFVASEDKATPRNPHTAASSSDHGAPGSHLELHTGSDIPRTILEVVVIFCTNPASSTTLRDSTQSQLVTDTILHHHRGKMLAKLIIFEF